MGKIFGSEHMGSKTVMGLAMLLAASTTAMGTTQNYGSISAGKGFPAITSQLQERAVVEDAGVMARVPRCTPGFTCNAPANQTARVSRHEALKFALLIGTSTSR